jgi:hypothetical protein
MATEHKQIAADDVGRPRLHDRVFVGQARRGLGEQRRELRVGPEGRQIQAIRVELA